MNAFNKMYMLSPQQFESLTRNKPPAETISNTAQNVLVSKMDGVLKQPGSAYSKSKQYNDLLEKYLALLRKDEARSRDIVLKLPEDSEPTRDTADGYARVEPPEDTIENDILENIGSRNRKNAAYILQRLRNSDLLSWNRAGEIIVEDETIKGSHIFDLMKTLSNRRFHTRQIPRGWEVFLKTISELNIPITTITNTQAREQMRFKPSQSSSVPVPRTRRSRRRQESFSDSEPRQMPTPLSPGWLDFTQ